MHQHRRRLPHRLCGRRGWPPTHRPQRVLGRCRARSRHAEVKLWLGLSCQTHVSIRICTHMSKDTLPHTCLHTCLHTSPHLCLHMSTHITTHMSTRISTHVSAHMPTHRRSRTGCSCRRQTTSANFKPGYVSCQTIVCHIGTIGRRVSNVPCHFHGRGCHGRSGAEP